MINEIDDIKVSVCVVTYNQEKYISECLDSVINQDCKFPFEIIVSDDASSDSTQEIIKSYQAKYPELIFPVLRTKNIGATKNILNAYKLAKGKYIAHLDGDDVFYAEKLRLQIQLLEDNPNCFMSSHAVNCINSKSEYISKKIGLELSDIKNYFYLLKNPSFFAHSSKIFRNTLDNSWYDQIKSEIYDFELHVMHGAYGDIFYTSKVLGAYRVFTGVSSAGNKINAEMVSAKFNMYEKNIVKYSGDKKVILKRAYAMSALNYAKGSILLKDLDGFKRYIEKSFSIYKLGFIQMSCYFLSKIPNFFLKLLINFKYRK